MISNIELTEENIIDLLLAAHRYNDIASYEVALKWFDSANHIQIGKVFTNEKIFTIPVDVLIDVISRNLCIQEIKVFLLCLDWAKYNLNNPSSHHHQITQPNLRQIMEPIFPYIKFNKISNLEIQSIVEPLGIVPRKYLLSAPVEEGPLKRTFIDPFETR